ncbi:MAG: HU family DNA-binding protein [Cetobacterium sp.]
MNKLGKKELARKMVDLGLFETIKDGSIAVNAFVDAVTQVVNEGDMVSIVGFGNFKTTIKKGRKIMHPSTRLEIDVPDKLIPKFIASKKLLVPKTV